MTTCARLHPRPELVPSPTVPLFDLDSEADDAQSRCSHYIRRFSSRTLLGLAHILSISLGGRGQPQDPLWV